MKLFVQLFCAWALVACGGGDSQNPNTVSSYIVGGSISGLGTATGLTLKNGSETISIPANAEKFSFSTKFVQNTNYSVSLVSQPLGLTCSVSGGDGTIVGANVSTVVVKCGISPVLAFVAGNLGGRGNVDGIGESARFEFLSSIAIDTAGNAYVTANSAVRKITPSGEVSTFAGLMNVRGSVDGSGASARFQSTNGIAIDRSGNLFVADGGSHTIRKITPAGLVSTLVGVAGVRGSTDGNGANAKFDFPLDVAIDRADNLYVTDSGNFTVRKVTPAGNVTTLAGTAGVRGSADGTGAAASFQDLFGVASDSADNLYVTDRANGTVRKITPTGVVITLAGTAGVAGSADGMGTSALFWSPSGIDCDVDGNLYLTDSGNGTVRKITSSGVVSTIAGARDGRGGSDDGNSAQARFQRPTGIAVDSIGNLYVTDSVNNNVRKITSAGMVSTLAGAAEVPGSIDGSGAQARFYGPRGLAADSQGNVYVADAENNNVRRISPAGVVSTLAGKAGFFGSTDGKGEDARFEVPGYVAVNGSGEVYVSDGSNHTIRKITPDGIVSTLAGTAGVGGSEDGFGAVARFYFPAGIATDNAGNVYVADSGTMTIRKITTFGVVSTLAGKAWVPGNADGSGTQASFTNLSGMAIDAAGNLYVCDSGGDTIRKITPFGVVSTLAGKAGLRGYADGDGQVARFNGIRGIAVDAVGNVYVAEIENHTIRKITPAGMVSTFAGGSGRLGFSAGALPASLDTPFGLAVSGTSLYLTLKAGVARITNLP